MGYPTFSMQQTPGNVIQYVAAPQANIYFDGILIDECYDIQYHYREAKEPIYGYLSQHFDKIVKGTVIITGALTINYKHDQYLALALKKAHDGNLPVTERNKRPKAFKDMQSQYKERLVEYSEMLKRQAATKKELGKLKTLLEEAKYKLSKKKERTAAAKEEAEWKEAEYFGTLSASGQERFDKLITKYKSDMEYNKKTVDEIATVRARIGKLETEATSDDLQYINGEIASTEARIAALRVETQSSDKDVRIKAATDLTYTLQLLDNLKEMRGPAQLEAQPKVKIAGLEAYIASLEKTKISPVDPYPDVAGFKDYLALQKGLEGATAEAAKVGNGGSDEEAEVKGLTSQVEALEAALKAIDLDGQRAWISQVKNVMDDFSVTDVNMAKELAKGYDGAKLNSHRAENSRGGFTIEFAYNGNAHKRIIGCELIGHSHVITQSGMPVKEQYTFLAKKLE